MTPRILIRLRYKSPYKHLFASKTLAGQRIFTRHQLFIVGVVEMFSATGVPLNAHYFTRTRCFEAVQTLRSPNKHKSAQFHTIRREYSFDVYFELSLGNHEIAPMHVVRFLNATFRCFESSLNYLTRVRFIVMGVI